MEELYKTSQYKGYTINWYPDDSQDDPREWNPNISHMICWHPRYQLGDKHDYAEPRDFLESLVSEFEEIEEDTSMEELYEMAEKHVAIYPVSALEHGGITMWIGAPTDPWDSGYVGAMYMTHEAVLQHVSDDESCWRENALKFMRGEMEIYDMYIRGDVYGYEVLTPDGEMYESCWGIYGLEGIEQAEIEIKSIIDKMPEL